MVRLPRAAVLGFACLLNCCRPSKVTPELALEPYGCWRVGGEATEFQAAAFEDWPGSELCIEVDRWVRRVVVKQNHLLQSLGPYDVIERFDGALARWTRTTSEKGALVWRSDPISIEHGFACRECADFRIEIQHWKGGWTIATTDERRSLTRLDDRDTARLRQRIGKLPSIESVCKSANLCARALQALPAGETQHVPRRSDHAHLRSCANILSLWPRPRILPEACRAEAPALSHCLETHTPDLFGGQEHVGSCEKPGPEFTEAAVLDAGSDPDAGTTDAADGVWDEDLESECREVQARRQAGSQQKPSAKLIERCQRVFIQLK